MSVDHLQINLAEQDQQDQQDRFDPPESRYRFEVNMGIQNTIGVRKKL
jgi:hypothetical protein